MNGPWHCEGDGQEGGLYVYHEERVMHRPREGSAGHPDEISAWRFGLDCLVERRRCLAETIRDARSTIRRLERRATTPKDTPNDQS